MSRPERDVRRLERLVEHRRLQLLRGRCASYIAKRMRLLQEAQTSLAAARRAAARTPVPQPRSWTFRVSHPRNMAASQVVRMTAASQNDAHRRIRERYPRPYKITHDPEGAHDDHAS